MTAVADPQTLLLSLVAGDRPAPAQVVQALLTLEKQKKTATYGLGDLGGRWRLLLITGTRKAQKRAGIALGKGRYLPPLVTITYEPGAGDRGETINRVALGALTLTVAGPVRWYARSQILAFDFLRWSLGWGDRPWFTAPLRSGTPEDFFAQPLKKQPFFHYFAIFPQLVAARGRGGGLAIWLRIDD